MPKCLQEKDPPEADWRALFTLAFLSCPSKDVLQKDVVKGGGEGGEKSIYPVSDLCEAGERERAV